MNPGSTASILQNNKEIVFNNDGTIRLFIDSYNNGVIDGTIYIGDPCYLTEKKIYKKGKIKIQERYNYGFLIERIWYDNDEVVKTETFTNDKQ